MPLLFNADGTLATELAYETGQRVPTAANLGELVLSASVTLDNDEIKALGAVAVTTNYPLIVAAPAEGRLQFVSGSVDFHSEGAYTGAGLGYVWINQDGIIPEDVSNGVVILSKASGDWMAHLSGPKQFEFEFVEPVEKTSPGALRLGSGFNTTPYGGGHANNTLTVTVLYTVVEL